MTQPIHPKLCKCHGLPMTWCFDPRYTKGGYFRCYKRDAETTKAWKEKHPGRVYLNESSRETTRKRRVIENA